MPPRGRGRTRTLTRGITAEEFKEMGIDIDELTDEMKADIQREMKGEVYTDQFGYTRLLEKKEDDDDYDIQEEGSIVDMLEDKGDRTKTIDELFPLAKQRKVAVKGDESEILNFLKKLKLQDYAEKFTNLTHLLHARTLELKAMGMTVRQRKELRKLAERYKQTHRQKLAEKYIHANAHRLQPEQLKRDVYDILYRHIYNELDWRDANKQIEKEWKLKVDNYHRERTIEHNNFRGLREPELMVMSSIEAGILKMDLDKEAIEKWMYKRHMQRINELPLAERAAFDNVFREMWMDKLGFEVEDLPAELQQQWKDAAEADEEEEQRKERDREKMSLEEKQAEERRKTMRLAMRAQRKKKKDEELTEEEEAAIAEMERIEEMKEMIEANQSHFAEIEAKADRRGAGLGEDEEEGEGEGEGVVRTEEDAIIDAQTRDILDASEEEMLYPDADEELDDHERDELAKAEEEDELATPEELERKSLLAGEEENETYPIASDEDILTRNLQTEADEDDADADELDADLEEKDEFDDEEEEALIRSAVAAAQRQLKIENALAEARGQPKPWSDEDIKSTIVPADFKLTDEEEEVWKQMDVDELSDETVDLIDEIEIGHDGAEEELVELDEVIATLEDDADEGDVEAEGEEEDEEGEGGETEIAAAAETGDVAEKEKKQGEGSSDVTTTTTAAEEDADEDEDELAEGEEDEEDIDEDIDEYEEDEDGLSEEEAAEYARLQEKWEYFPPDNLILPADRSIEPVDPNAEIDTPEKEQEEILQIMMEVLDEDEDVERDDRIDREEEEEAQRLAEEDEMDEDEDEDIDEDEEEGVEEDTDDSATADNKPKQ